VKPYYEQSGATIYHGDCRDVLGDCGAVDLVLTDPPYGVTYQSNTGGHRGKEPITNDGTRLSLALYRQVMPMIAALPPTHVLWFTRWDAWPDVWMILGQFFQIRGLLVWDKGTPGMGDLNHWGPSYELIASAGRGQTSGSRDQSVLTGFPGVPHLDRNHPTEKPERLLSYLIWKLGASTVLDPFMGSGSTLVAAQASGCRSVGIEVDERYCEVAAKRLAQCSLFVAGAGISDEPPRSGGLFSEEAL
jgi:site-specific DNA-methyltransferase (adenine-specific)